MSTDAKSSPTMTSLSVDNVIFGYRTGVLSVLLVKHGRGLARGRWSLPGDWPRVDESLEECAARILFKQTALQNIALKQLHTFSAVDRYPDQRIVTTAFYTVLRQNHQTVTPGRTEQDASWVDVRAIPELMFDHSLIVRTGIKALQQDVRKMPFGMGLLDDSFTFLALQTLYETLLDCQFDKPNFRRKLLAMKHLEPVGQTVKQDGHRSAALFQFNQQKYQQLEQAGFSFAL